MIVRPVDAAKSAEKQEAPLEAEKQIDSASGIEDQEEQRHLEKIQRDRDIERPY